MTYNRLIRKVLTCVLALVAVFSIICGITAFTKTANAQVVTPQKKVELYQLQTSAYNLMESYVIKTVNDKLIVIDGGRDSYNTEYVGATGGTAFDSGAGAAPYIINALRAISGKSAGEAVEVEAWFLSHAHGDHFFELAKALYGYVDSQTVTLSDDVSENFGQITYATDTNFTVKNFYFDFPNAPGSEKNATNSTNWSNISESLLKILKEGFENYAQKNNISVADGSTYYDDLNGSIINETAIKEGLVISVDGVDIHVLQTWSPSDGNANDNSLILKVFVDGQSILFLNDAGIESGKRLMDTYGAGFLESDIIQLAHHGQNGTDKAFYDAINAKDKIRLWAMPVDVWNDDGTYSSVDYYDTTSTREWLGLPYSPEQATLSLDSKKDIVGGLYSLYPTAEGSESAYSIPVSAWTKDVLNGMKIDLPYDNVYSSDFVMEKGASIRLVEGSNGLRFTARLSCYEDTSEYGFIILPTQYITKNTITGNYHSELDAKNIDYIDLPSNVYQQGLHYLMNGSIANIKYNNINVSFTGIAYEKKTDGTYRYADFANLSDVSRTVGKVAVSAINELEYNQDLDVDVKDLYIENESVLWDYVNKSINKKTGAGENAIPTYEFSFSDTQITLEIGQSEELELLTYFDKSCVIWSSSDKKVATVSNGMVTAVGLGNATITAQCAGFTASVEINSSISVADGYLASFDNSAYEKLIKASDRPARGAQSVTAEYVGSFGGESNVVKVTAVGAVADIVIDLPKSCTTGMTVKYMITEASSTFMTFARPDLTDIVGLKTITLQALTEEQLNKWNVDYINYASVNEDYRNQLYIELSVGQTDGVTVFYFAFIKDGDARTEEVASSLKDGYLADFSSDVYANLFTPLYGAIDGITYMDNFEGEDSVIKVEITTSSTCSGGFKFKMPKGADGQTIEVRLYGTPQAAWGVDFLNPDNDSSVISIHGSIKNKWANIKFDYSTYTTDDVFALHTYSGGSSEKIIIYLSFIRVVAMPTQPTESGYLADFDSYAYENIVSACDVPQGTPTVSATYLPEFNGETGVVRITGSIVASSTAFNVTMPKSATGKIQVRIYNEFAENTAQGFAFGNPDSAGADEWQNVTLAKNKWSTITLDYSSISTKDVIEIYTYFGATEVAPVIYFAWVRELAEVAQPQDGYLADFDSYAYEANVIACANPQGNTPSVQAIYLDSFNGETGVIKIESSIVDMSSTYKIILPKYASGQIQIRIYNEFGNTAQGFAFGNPDTDGIEEAHSVNMPKNDWATFTLDYSEYTNSNVIEIYTYFGNTDTAPVIYLAWVMGESGKI